jgi:1-acyl-sn-glycerol-3-phosphate acyltransferase
MADDIKLKPQTYKDERPAEYFTRFHTRVRNHRPNWDYELVRTVLTPYLVGFFRARAIATDNVPSSGPMILAPNHFSFLDHFFLAVFLRRKVHFMAKSNMFVPPLWPIYNYGGVFPVRRGARDEEAFITARAILDRGDIVVMYVEGGRSRTGGLGEPKPGLGRLALETGVPVVPVGIVGSEKVRNWKRLQFPNVTVQFGEPFRFEQVEHPERDQGQAASEVVFGRIKALWEGLLEHGRAKSRELARK